MVVYFCTTVGTRASTPLAHYITIQSPSYVISPWTLFLHYQHKTLSSRARLTLEVCLTLPLQPGLTCLQPPWLPRLWGIGQYPHTHNGWLQLLTSSVSTRQEIVNSLHYASLQIFGLPLDLLSLQTGYLVNLLSIAWDIAFFGQFPE